MSERIGNITSRLKEIVHELSGYPVEDLPEESTFLELGFDSLFLTQLATAFQNEFARPVTFRQLFDELPSIGALGRRFDEELPPDAYAPAQEPTSNPGSNLHQDPGAGEAGFRADMDSFRAGPGPSPEGLPFPAPLFPGPGPHASGLVEILSQQLELMGRQLAFLAGHPQGAGPSPGAFPTLAEPPQAPAQASSTPSAGSEGGSAEDGTPQEGSTALPAGFGPSLSTPARKEIQPRHQEHLLDLTARYTERTRRSKDQTQKYRRWHADPRTASGFNPLWKEMVYPIWVNRSSGSRLWDIDGNEYIDLLNGFGPNFLGHSPPFVTQALKEQLDRGIEVGPQTPLAGETAQLFCQATGMDRVSFVNTGSEAVQAAIRLSRTVTGRDKIVVFRKDYHGNFDEVLIRGITVKGEPSCMPLAPGIPRRAVQDVVALRYGSDEALEWIRSHGTELAAVLVEPVQSRTPELQPRLFLQELRKITTDCGAVLVFDEVITGFRTGLGGAQAMFGVDADLATYGKVLASGMPIGAVAGRARFMDTFDGGMWSYGDQSFPEAGVTFFAGTFVRHPLAIAAANVTLKYLLSAGPSLWEGVHRRTAHLTAALNEMFSSGGIQIEIPHCCSQMFFRVNDRSDLANLLFFHLRLRGVYLLEGFPSYMTVSHSDEDVEAIIERCLESVEEMQEAGVFAETSSGTPGPLPDLEARRFPLTTAQRDVWLASQLSPEASCAFNESDTVVLRGPLHLEALREAVGRVLGRHQAFHLRIAGTGDFQEVLPDAPPELRLVDLGQVEQEPGGGGVDRILAEQARLPFELASGPLVRPLLIRIAEDHHLLVLYGHHIVFDGWSADVVMREVALAYSALAEARESELGIPLPFSDYQATLRRFQDGLEGRTSLEFWRSSLAGSPPWLELPTDRPRPAERTFNGSTVHAQLASNESLRILEAARRIRVTPHALVFSAFQLLLSRLSGQEDFVVGVPAAGQAAVGMNNLVGYCVNLMPVRCTPAGDRPFADFARDVWRIVLDCFEHQKADFSELLRILPHERDPSRLPLVEVVFNHSGYLRKLEFAGLTSEARENKRCAVLHDFFLNVVESDGGLVVDWDYNRDLWDEETIRQWIGHLEVILSAVAENPNQTLQEVPLMTTDQETALVRGWTSR